MFAQALNKGILSIFGWKAEALTPDFEKNVFCVAPHTSNWDFLIGQIGHTAMGRKGNFVIKKEWMRGPIGWLLAKLGGIPVDRSKASRFTDQMADEFAKRKRFNLAFTPEGTRKANPKWKKGFYHVALKANVPIVLVKIDYAKKVVSLFEVFEPTGDEHADLFSIQKRFVGVTARHPEQFVLPDNVVNP
jgi:1-acyl-sn-glycerol-3-phosphate acyltransferase